MKTSALMLASVVALATPIPSPGFTNLNFEAAVVQLNDPAFGWLDWNLAVPGWSHSAGDSTEIVYYGSPHLGMSQWFLLLDTNSFPFGRNSTPLAGDYSLAFVSGFASAAWATNWTSAFISQSGNIPADARSLQLLATGPFDVFVGGTLIPMHSLGGNSYGGDITSFAGTFAELTIRNASPPPCPCAIWMPTVVDDISFSPITIPEPTVLAMLAAGFGGMLARRRRAGPDRKLAASTTSN